MLPVLGGRVKYYWIRTLSPKTEAGPPGKNGTCKSCPVLPSQNESEFHQVSRSKLQLWEMPRAETKSNEVMRMQ